MTPRVEPSTAAQAEPNAAPQADLSAATPGSAAADTAAPGTATPDTQTPGTATPDSAAYRSVVGHFATGVTVVTSVGAAGPTGLTASAICSLSLEPLLMVVCLDHGSRTLAAVRKTRRLAVNVLSREQEELAVRFASKAPEAEKFDGVAYREEDGLPVLDGAIAWLTGEVRDLLPGGDHLIGVTEVAALGAPGGDPLIYHRGDYRALG